MMTDFFFIRRELPRQLVVATGFAIAGLITAAAVFLMFTANARSAATADMKDTIQRANLLKEVGAAGLASDAYYKGETPQLAQAALQTDLQKLAEEHSIQIEVMRADEIEQIDGVVRLNLTLNGVAPEPELGAFLHSISLQKPIVIVDQLTLRRARTTSRTQARRVAFQTQLFGILKR